VHSSFILSLAPALRSNLNLSYPTTNVLYCRNLDNSMDFDSDFLEQGVPHVQPMDRSLEDSFSLGEIMEQNSTGSFVLSGAAEDLPVPPVPPATGLFDGIVNKVKNMVQKQDDLDVSQQHSTGSLGESGLNNSTMSAAHQSSHHLAGAYFVQPSAKR